MRVFGWARTREGEAWKEVEVHGAADPRLPFSKAEGGARRARCPYSGSDLLPLEPSCMAA